MNLGENMKDLIIGTIATIWGIAVVVRVSIKFLESDATLQAYSVGSLIGGVLGLALAIWGIVKIKNWVKNR